MYHSPAPPPSLSPIQNCSGVSIQMYTWKGFFVSSVPHPAPSKAIARRGPYLKRTTARAQSRQACLQKYVRYNQSAKGQLRFQRRGAKQARADYVREYALTDHGRAKRAQARAAYKARQKLVKRPSQNSKTAIPQYRMGSFDPPDIIWVPKILKHCHRACIIHGIDPVSKSVVYHCHFGCVA